MAPFLLFLLLLGGCASPEVVLQDVIKPPIILGPIHRIGVVVWPTNNPEQKLFQSTLLRNLSEVPQLHPVAIPVKGDLGKLPLEVPVMAHLSGANDILLVHILSHRIHDRRVISGDCESPPCQSMNMPMTVRTNSMRLHITFLRAFPFHIELDRIVTVRNSDKKIPFSLFQRHFTPQETLNLRLYAKASQHIRYLFSTLVVSVRRPFYFYDIRAEKAYKSLQANKPVLALFFLDSDYNQLLKKKKPVPAELYTDMGVTYEALRDYSLADYYYKKAAKFGKRRILLAFDRQLRSMVVYFIGINFFEKGVNSAQPVP
ncbi:MAG: hypothetical protein ACP5OP_07750 [Leptospirillia bacterium]